MLNFRRQPSAETTSRVLDSTRSVADTNPDLRIRDLRDDPRLRVWFAGSIGATVSRLPTRVRGTSMSPALREGVPPAAA